MSVIFKSLKKVKQQNGDRPGSRRDRPSSSGSVYTYRRILFSPLVLLLVAAMAVVLGLLIYYGVQSLSSKPSSRTSRTTARVEVPAEPETASPETTAKAAQPEPSGREASFDAPAPPEEIPVEEAQPEQLSLSPYAAQPGQPGSESGKQVVTIIEPSPGYSVSRPAAAVNTTPGIAGPATAGGAMGNTAEETPPPDQGAVPVPTQAAPVPVTRSTGVLSAGAPRTDKPRREAGAGHDPARAARLAAGVRKAIATGDKSTADRLMSDLTAVLGVEHVHILNLQAFRLMKKGDYEKAAVCLSKVLLRDKDNLDAGLNMAVLEMKTGRPDEAEKRLLRLKEKYPDSSSVLVLLSKLGR